MAAAERPRVRFSSEQEQSRLASAVTSVGFEVVSATETPITRRDEQVLVIEEAELHLHLNPAVPLPLFLMTIRHALSPESAGPDDLDAVAPRVPDDEPTPWPDDEADAAELRSLRQSRAKASEQLARLQQDSPAASDLHKLIGALDSEIRAAATLQRLGR